ISGTVASAFPSVNDAAPSLTRLCVFASMRRMTDAAWTLYLSAAIIGGAFGYVIQRGGFCLMRALANLFLMGDATLMRAYALALLVAMAGVQALSASGLVEIPVRPFHWLSNVTGGLVFGAGMVLAGGRAGRTGGCAGGGAGGAGGGLPRSPPRAAPRRPRPA